MTCYFLSFFCSVLLCCMLCWTRDCDVWGGSSGVAVLNIKYLARKCLSSYSHVEIRCLVAPWLLSLGLSSLTGMEGGGLTFAMWSLVSGLIISSTGYALLWHTWHRDTRDLRLPAFSVWDTGLLNMSLSVMVASQNENLFAK